MTKTIIGIDVGGTKTAVVEGTFDGAILQRHVGPTEGHRPFADTFPALAERMVLAMERARASGRRPIAISVAVAGPVDARAGRLLDPPNLLGWHGVALKATLEDRFPLPVYVEHDAKAGALAEFRFGVGATRPGLADLVFLTFGTGNGAGIIANGRLVRGASEMAGEVWMLAVAGEPDMRLTADEGWESVSSGRGLLAVARRLEPGRWSPEARIRDIVDAALAGDPGALGAVEECGRWLGAGMAALVTVLNPRVIVVGSLAVVLGERLLGPARAVLARRAQPRAVAACEVVPSALGPRLGDVQSLMAALDALES